ncbi:hypothetical protein I2900191A2_11210 [Intestinibacter bartlettii]
MKKIILLFIICLSFTLLVGCNNPSQKKDNGTKNEIVRMNNDTTISVYNPFKNSIFEKLFKK